MNYEEALAPHSYCFEFLNSFDHFEYHRYQMSFKMHVIDVKNPLQNYIWILEELKTHDAIVVDPTDAQLVDEYCQMNKLDLKQIWLTHWHKDHIGGAPFLADKYQLSVYGPKEALCKINGIGNLLKDVLDLKDHYFNFHDLKVKVIFVPGHTLGHIVFYINELNSLFSGDTLFAMGFGRVFEGSYEQMYQSLNRLKQLPLKTKVYCSHEYTLSNAQFALEVDSNNVLLQERLQEVRALRAEHQITLPTTIERELQTNPFFRTKDLDDFLKKRLLKDHY